MAFLEEQFPVNISYGSGGGPGYKTEIIVIRSGFESRDVGWTYPRHKYDAATGVKTIDDMEQLIEFFHAVGGMAYGFRYKDWADFKSCNTTQTISDTDQLIGEGDNVEVDFQIIKTYIKGSFSRVRNISKPVNGTVVVSLDDVPQPTGWSVNLTTGVITFSVAPGSTVDVKAGYEFDVPCRFDTDELQVGLEFYNAGNAQVPLIEIRDIS